MPVLEESKLKPACSDHRQFPFLPVLFKVKITFVYTRFLFEGFYLHFLKNPFSSGEVFLCLLLKSSGGKIPLNSPKS